jgi:hypothetical protein
MRFSSLLSLFLFLLSIFQSKKGLILFDNEDARNAALSAAKAADEEAKKVELEIEKVRLRKQLEAQLKEEQLAREKDLTGVAAKKAFFARQVEGAVDVTKSNEQQIKEEAAQRKALKDAQLKLNSAISDVSSISNFRRRSVLRREIEFDLRKAQQEAEEEEKRKEEEEKAARAGSALFLFF